MTKSEILSRLAQALEIIDKIDGYLANDGKDCGSNWCGVGT